MKFFTNGLVAIGIFIGISIFLLFEFAVDFFGDSIQPSETLVAAILGAAIALTGTLFTIYASKEERISEKNSKELALGYALFEVLNENVSDIRFIREHIQTGLATADSKGEAFRAIGVMELAGRASFTLISSEMKTLLLSRKFLELYNKIGRIDHHAKGYIDNFEVSMRMRKELIETFDTSAMLSGRGFQPKAGFELEARARHDVLNEGFEDLARQIVDTEVEFIDVIKETGKLLAELGDPNFRFEFKP